jgi:hypothetical protein
MVPACGRPAAGLRQACRRQAEDCRERFEAVPYQSSYSEL